MELLQYWKIIRKSLWMVVLVVVVGLASTAVYTLNQPTLYESTSTLLLNPSVPSALVPYVQNQVAANLADSYTQLMRTRSFGESVVEKLPFSMSPGAVSRSVSTKLEPNTLFYRVTATMDTPERAQQLLSTVLDVFLSANSDKVASQPNDANSEIRQRLEDELKYIDDVLKVYDDDIKALQAQPASVEGNTQLLELRSQSVTLQQTKTQTLTALSQLRSNEVAPNSALLIDQPLPGAPLADNLLRNLGLALSVSLLIGVGIAFLRDYLDYTVHSPEHLEEMLKLTPLAAVGKVGESIGRGYGYGRRKARIREAAATSTSLSGHRLVVLEHPKSPESESFRVLRTNIQFSSVDDPVHTMVVTSASPGEGKSFTASNLAVVIAQAGKRVILVDADLRKPGLHKVFELPNQTGFTNLILGGMASSEGAIQPVPSVPNLTVITSGPLPPNPSELLNSHQAMQVMQELAQRADMVIYDAPPAGVVTDPTILATRVDAVLLVINAGTTRRDIILRVRQNLEKVGAKLVMPVLNRVSLRDLQGYYYYYHYQNYGSETKEEATSAGGHHLNGKVPLSATDEPVVTHAAGGQGDKGE